MSIRDSFNWNTRVGVFKVPTCSGSLGPSGTLNGHVMDSVTSDPIAGASIAASLSMTQTFGTTTDPSGDYQMIIPVGTYDRDSFRIWLPSGDRKRRRCDFWDGHDPRLLPRYGSDCAGFMAISPMQPPAGRCTPAWMSPVFRAVLSGMTRRRATTRSACRKEPRTTSL